MNDSSNRDQRGTTGRTPTPEEAAALVRQRAQQATPAAASAAVQSDHGQTNDHGEGVHMPSPSICPIVAAFGVTMISFGILTGWAFGVFGGVVLAISLWKWVGEMRSDAA